jgi:hypothetical protein
MEKINKIVEKWNNENISWSESSKNAIKEACILFAIYCGRNADYYKGRWVVEDEIQFATFTTEELFKKFANNLPVIE